MFRCGTWRYLGVALCLGFGLSHTPAAAQQLVRDVTQKAGSVAFTVQFRDARSQVYKLDFAFPARTYAKAKDGLPPIDQDAIRNRMRGPVESYVARQREAWRQDLRAYMNRLARSVPHHVKLDHSFKNGRLHWRLESESYSQRELERLSGRLERQINTASKRLLERAQANVDRYATRVRDDVVADLNYIRDPYLDVLRVDYRRIAHRAVQRLEPLARAIAEKAGTDARNRLRIALSFLQAVPYDELTDRNVADGSGFASPIEMLHLNRGDCDSKAVALAALMQRLAPEVRTAMLLLPGHAVLAADIPRRRGDRVVSLKGREYVLMEPAGPAQVPVGAVGDKSARAIDAGEVESVVWMNG